MTTDKTNQEQGPVVNKKFATFYDLFKLQVKSNPKAIAAIFEENSLTYEELDIRATLLADFLKANGVKSETIVGLSLHNGLDLLVGILGIFQSGGAYLPIDPTFPEARIKSMVEDAKPILILTEQNLHGKLSSLSCKIALINAHPVIEEPGQYESIQPNDLAYVVYTSGSTGKPKGIMVEHLAFSQAALSYKKLHPTKLISLMSGSISFDASLLVISHTLTSGGVVCIPKTEMVIDPERIISLIEKHAINYTLCVPSFYSMLLNKSRKLPSLQSIDLAGENIPNTLPEIHSKLAPNATLYNVYGPSEHAIGATFEKIYDPITKEVNKITIGKPFSNTQVFILDEKLQQVSPGAKGEIFIGGVGLARGYLNNEALTMEKFIWVSLPGQEPLRLYRTGDCARFLPEGNMEFLGRLDHQVKIRGYRIELGEIEYSICQHPKVDEAVVLALEEMDGRKRLVAYFSSRIKEQISEQVRAYLQAVLPQYMIPSTLIQIDHWPRTPNGKIDRAVLSTFPEACSPMCYLEKPLSGLELKLFQIWKQILGRDLFNLDTNFFDLGGDSLQVASVQTLLQEALGYKVNILDLFQYPTISQLARYLSSKNKEQDSSSTSQELAKKQKSAFQKFEKFRKGDLV